MLIDKIGHFGDVPQANLLAWYRKTKPNTTAARIYQSKEMYLLQHKKIKARFSCLLRHNIRPGNGEGLFLFRCFIPHGAR